MNVSGDVTIEAADGGSFAAYCAWPKQTPAPGIVVLTPVFGVDADMRGFVDRYAQRGYIAIAPDLFWRDEPGVLRRTEEERAVALARARRVDVELCAGDVRSTVDALSSMPQCSGKVGAIGFCFGGRYAYIAAARRDVAVAGAFHGTEIGLSLAGEPPAGVPVSLHFGAADPLTPEEEVAAIAAALRGNLRAEICVYPGAAHNFSIPGNPAYDGAAAQLSETRVFALFDGLK